MDHNKTPEELYKYMAEKCKETIEATSQEAIDNAVIHQDQYPKIKKPYSTPKLVVYGDIHILTGSVGMMGSTLDAGGMLKTS